MRSDGRTHWRTGLKNGLHISAFQETLKPLGAGTRRVGSNPTPVAALRMPPAILRLGWPPRGLRSRPLIVACTGAHPARGRRTRRFDSALVMNRGKQDPRKIQSGAHSGTVVTVVPNGGRRAEARPEPWAQLGPRARVPCLQTVRPGQ
jgi:hypothetical protein